MNPVTPVITSAAGIATTHLLQARRLPPTPAQHMTTMTPRPGCLVTVVHSTIVILASKLGLPVSTTHVSCGALFGVGAVTRQAHWNIIVGILLAWITTLPLAAAFGALGFFALNRWLVT